MNAGGHPLRRHQAPPAAGSATTVTGWGAQSSRTSRRPPVGDDDGATGAEVREALINTDSGRRRYDPHSPLASRSYRPSRFQSQNNTFPVAVDPLQTGKVRYASGGEVRAQHPHDEGDAVVEIVRTDGIVAKFREWEPEVREDP